MVVELSNTRYDLSVLASGLDIRSELIYRWRREDLANLDASFPGQGNEAMIEEQKELARLKKELLDAWLERDILEKSCKHFLQVS